MKKYLAISLLLHILPFLVINFHKGSNNSNKGIGQVDGTSIQEIKLIVSPGKDGDQPKPRSFYWGVGIMSAMETINCDPFGVKVLDVYEGYSGYDSGLQKDDAICLINGKQITDDNDIAGNSPKSNMVLTVIRNKETIHITLNRVKIYYDGGR